MDLNIIEDLKFEVQCLINPVFITLNVIIFFIIIEYYEESTLDHFYLKLIVQMEK